MTEREILIEKQIVREACKLLKCHVGRITKPNKMLFFVMGYNRRSENQWFTGTDDNATPINFDYVEEHVVASGKTYKELWASIKYYHKLSKMSMKRFLDYCSHRGGLREALKP